MEDDAGKRNAGMDHPARAPPAACPSEPAPGSARAVTARAAAGGARTVSVAGAAPRKNAWDPWAVGEDGNWAD
eukprot:6986376-Lingulodinium_polyedra.AAC.1